LPEEPYVSIETSDACVSLGGEGGKRGEFENERGGPKEERRSPGEREENLD